MIGYMFAFISTLAVSAKDAFAKKALKNIDEYVVAWASRCFALILILPLLFFARIPEIGNSFWKALFIGGTLNMLAILCYMKAVKSSNLSKVIPLLAFTPLFVLVTSRVMLSESPKFFGIVGVLLIVAGSYILNIKERTKGYIVPFKTLLTEKGARLMLLTAFLWSITSNYDKIGVENSSPVFWAFALNAFNSLLLFFLMICRSKDMKQQISSSFGTLLIIGFAVGIAFTAQMVALKYVFVSYVIAIEKLHILIAVFSGWLFFREKKEIREKLFGSVMMLVGVLLIILS